MALTNSTYQFIEQLGPLTLVDATAGPDGPTGVIAFYLVGANGYHNATRLPHEVVDDLNSQGFDKKVIEGIEYLLVPKTASNLPGRLSYYAQTTGVADLQNPPGGGVNALREQLKGTTATNTNDPEGVAKFVEDAEEAWDEAKRVRDEENAIIDRAVNDAPARSHADASLNPAPSTVAPTEESADADDSEDLV